MQLLRDVARQARFEAMQPVPLHTDARVLAASGLTVAEQVDVQAFERAVNAANNARYWRACKAQVIAGTRPNTGMRACDYEALARKSERIVRELALQSEIRLQRRADAARFDRALIGTMLGVAS